MGQLLQDMSRLSPAPTVKRETLAMIASLAVILPAFAAILIFLDQNRPLNIALAGILLLWVLGRWAFSLVRGDVGASVSSRR